jgi:hypothetical protein
VDGRDAIWGHPDLLPDEEAFADPEAFATAAPDFDFPPIDPPDDAPVEER